jgi:hypothetical protein
VKSSAVTLGFILLPFELLYYWIVLRSSCNK